MYVHNHFKYAPYDFQVYVFKAEIFALLSANICSCRSINSRLWSRIRIHIFVYIRFDEIIIHAFLPTDHFELFILIVIFLESD